MKLCQPCKDALEQSSAEDRLGRFNWATALSMGVEIVNPQECQRCLAKKEVG